MAWGALVLILAGLFATGTAFYLHQETQRLKFLGLFWAAAIFVAVEIGILVSAVTTGGTLDFITSQVIEWGHIYSLALILSSLLLFIRESKPEFSQFPIFYGILPFLIIISYLLVYNTVILKDWLINIYQAGAIIVAILMYGIYSYRDDIYRTLAAGAILFGITFILYLAMPGHKLLWELFLAGSIITSFSGYIVVQRHYIDSK